MMATMLKFATINVGGMSGAFKRTSVFKSLLNSHFDIIALQEAHCTHENYKAWEKQWPGRSFWNPGTAHTTGVGFLFDPSLDCEVLNQDSDHNGRILRLSLKICDCHFQVVNVYGPHTSSAAQGDFFFRKVQTSLHTDLPTVMFGDFNMVENISLDKQGAHPSKQSLYGLSGLNALTRAWHLTDVWRNCHPGKRQFTRHCFLDKTHSRIDRIYVPTPWLPFIVSSSIHHFVWSDHDLCVFRFSLPNTIQKGRGYWKLNLQYLEHPKYKDIISAFWQHWRHFKPDYDDIQVWWDVGKTYIKSLTIEYARDLYILNKTRREDLLTQLRLAREQPDAAPHDIQFIKSQLKALEIETHKKIFVHTHTVVREPDETPSKYFYSLLKARQHAAVMSRIKNSHGHIVTTQPAIMSATKTYYSTLYSAADDVSLPDQTFFLDQITQTLPEASKLVLDADLQLQELTTALNGSNNEKSAGYDGLPYEFYKTFWPLLSADLFALATFTLHNGHPLPYSQRTSMITLLYKKNDRASLDNWRPISLLCCDYKLISKAIANRLKTVLHMVLAPTQTCGVPGRTVFEPLFLIRDVLFYCDSKQINGYLLSLDQEKAFDKLNRDFLFKVLHKMNFGPHLIKWIHSLYTDNVGHVLVNGYTSPGFTISRGVKQGCPLSPLLFSLYIETLSLGFKSHPQIHGIPIPGRSNPLITQYADDTTLFLSERTQLRHVFDLLSQFERATGSTINQAKTTGLLIGKPAYLDPLLTTVQWNNDDGLKILGITFFTDFLRTQNFNWSHRLTQLTSELDRHATRTLSLKGKVLILNTVAMAKLWHLATVIFLPPWLAKSLLTCLFDFLWGLSGVNPIKRTTLFQPKAKGGLGLKNPLTQQLALQLKFVRQLVDPNTHSPWVPLARYWLGFHLAPLHPAWAFLRGNHLPTPDGNFRPPFYDNVLQTFKRFAPTTLQWTTSYFYLTLTEALYEPPTAYANFWTNIPTITENLLWKHVYMSFALGKHQESPL